jgi:hypothetical protein
MRRNGRSSQQRTAAAIAPGAPFLARSLREKWERRSPGFGKGTTSMAAEKLRLAMILGGAAVHGCDNQPVFNEGFSR